MHAQSNEPRHHSRTMPRHQKAPLLGQPLRTWNLRAVTDIAGLRIWNLRAVTASGHPPLLRRSCSVYPSVVQPLAALPAATGRASVGARPFFLRRPRGRQGGSSCCCVWDWRPPGPSRTLVNHVLSGRNHIQSRNFITSHALHHGLALRRVCGQAGALLADFVRE